MVALGEAQLQKITPCLRTWSGMYITQYNNTQKIIITCIVWNVESNTRVSPFELISNYVENHRPVLCHFLSLGGLSKIVYFSTSVKFSCHTVTVASNKHSQLKIFVGNWRKWWRIKPKKSNKSFTFENRDSPIMGANESGIPYHFQHWMWFRGILLYSETRYVNANINQDLLCLPTKFLISVDPFLGCVSVICTCVIKFKLFNNKEVRGYFVGETGL